MHRLSTVEVVEELIAVLESNLAEMVSGANKSEYIIGSWEASIECLEVICCWTKARAYGLDYNPEVKYNIYK